MTTNENVVHEIFAAINRNDIPAVLEHFDPQIERIEPAVPPSVSTYHGLAEVKAHFSAARDNWAEGSCQLEQVITAGDKVIALVHVRVRLKNKTDWNEGHIADVFIFRSGKVIQMQTFMDRQEALASAGVKS